jgi:hypothetical protein
MRMDRDHVVQVLRQQGRADLAERAARELGPSVDSVEDADLLRSLGIDPDARAQGGAPAVTDPATEPDTPS